MKLTETRFGDAVLTVIVMLLLTISVIGIVQGIAPIARAQSTTDTNTATATATVLSVSWTSPITGAVQTESVDLSQGQVHQFANAMYETFPPLSSGDGTLYIEPDSIYLDLNSGSGSGSLKVIFQVQSPLNIITTPFTRVRLNGMVWDTVSGETWSVTGTATETAQ